MSAITEAFKYALENCSEELGAKSTDVEKSLGAFQNLETKLGGRDE